MPPIRTIVLATALCTAACASRAQQVVTLYDHGDYAAAARTADSELASHPDDEALWQMRIRAALAQGDVPGLAKTYAAYRAQLGGDDDRALLRDLATATLGQALTLPSAKVKIAAINAIAAAELQALADQVAERMTDDDDKVAATAAIAILRAYPQAPKVAGDMLHSEDAEARRIAVDGIGQKVGKLAQGDLQKAAADPDPRVRRAAVRWLGQLQATTASATLVAALADPDDTVRAAAASSLAKLGAAVDLGALGRRAIDDRALPVRLAGIELLAAAIHVTNGQAQRAALIALADDPDPFVATEAATAAGDPGLAGKALDRAIAAPDWAVRAGAANIAIRAVGKPAALVTAHKLAGDPDIRVRLAAARLLAYAGDPAAALPIFVDALTSPDALQAAVELAKQDDARGIAALEAAVRDPAHSPASRAAAAEAHRSARRITPGLVAALADESGAVRVQAAAALIMLARHDRDD